MVKSIFGYIDGETPIDDVSGLIPNIGSRKELNEYEAANVLDAVVKYSFIIPVIHEGREFDYSWMVNIHKDMFGRVWKWAGETRREDLTIGIGWTLIEEQLFDLCESIPYFKDPSDISNVAYLHHRLVQIHPFKNGNGRWSRFVANIYQIRSTGKFTEWPDDLIGTTSNTSSVRDIYIQALKEADIGNHNNLIRLHEQFAKVMPDNM